MNAPDPAPAGTSSAAATVTAAGPTVGSIIGVIAGNVLAQLLQVTGATEHALIVACTAIVTAFAHWLSAKAKNLL
jgi:hypothetical protein